MPTKKPKSPKSRQTKIKDITDPQLLNHLAIIRSAPKDSILYRANQNLLDDSGSTWGGAGLLHFGGLYWWAAACELFVTNLSGLSGVSFSATGTGATVGAVECEVGGAFLVDPSTIAGPCHCTIAFGAVAEGVVGLSLLSTSGTLYGYFSGNASGVGVGGVHGSGSLTLMF